MSEEEIRRGKIVIASAGLIFFKKKGGQIRILVAKRQTEPWKGFNMIVFGGLVDKEDNNVKDAAFREGNEETGGTLHFQIRHLVGVYGPTSYHHKLKCCGTKLVAIATLTPVSDKHFVTVVYAAEIFSGRPTQNPEALNFKFINPLRLAEKDFLFAFDGALVLSDFWKKIKHNPSGKNLDRGST